MSGPIPTDRGPNLPKAIADTLMYVSYATNRRLCPQIPPERYTAAGYPDVPAMEAKYQAERAIGKARAQAEIDETFRGLT